MIQDSNFEQSIAKVKTHIQDVAFNLDPDKCEIYSTSTVARHFTLVVMMPDEIAAKMNDFIERLKVVEPSLMVGAKDLLHLTLYYLPDDIDTEEIESFLTDFFKDKFFDFNFDSLIYMPKGIGVAAFPTNMNFVDLRRALGKKFSYPYVYTELEFVSWITVARYTEQPSRKLLDFLRENFETSFGSMKVDSIDVFDTNDKNLKGAKKLFSIVPNSNK